MLVRETAVSSNERLKLGIIVTRVAVDSEGNVYVYYSGLVFLNCCGRFVTMLLCLLDHFSYPHSSIVVGMVLAEERPNSAPTTASPIKAEEGNKHHDHPHHMINWLLINFNIEAVQKGERFRQGKFGLGDGVVGNVDVVACGLTQVGLG